MLCSLTHEHYQEEEGGSWTRTESQEKHKTYNRPRHFIICILLILFGLMAVLIAHGRGYLQLIPQSVSSS